MGLSFALEQNGVVFALTDPHPSTDPDIEDLTHTSRINSWNKSDHICKNLILYSLSNELYYQYDFVCDILSGLNKKYALEGVGNKTMQLVIFFISL